MRKSPGYSFNYSQFYGVKDSQIKLSSACTPAHVSVAMEDIIAKLPDYDLAQWWEGIYRQINTVVYTATLSGATVSLCLLAEDAALAKGYSANTANWMSTSLRSGLLLGQSVYGIYQGLEVVETYAPLLASEVIYRGLNYTGLAESTAKAASFVGYYGIKMALGSWWQTGCSFFASACGGYLGKHVGHTVSQYLWSQPIEA